jgi:hypothetical protein
MGIMNLDDYRYRVDCYHGGKFIRSTIIIIGGSYTYDPPNKRSIRDRGRVCRLLEYDPFGKDWDKDCRAEWLDTNQQFNVNATDLIRNEK